MDYLKTYYKIVENAKRLEREGYLEIHHIIPRSVYGTGILDETGLEHVNDKNNLISLTPREHFIAHWLLARAFPENKQLVGAFWAMSNFAKPQGQRRNYTVSSRAFEEARVLFSQSKFKPIIQYSLEGEFIRVFDSRMEASIELGIHMSGLSSGEKKSAGGYLWREDTENYPLKIESYKIETSSKPVVQLSPDGCFYINSFPSVIAASEKLGINFRHISSCCVGRRSSSGGYKWMFEEDYDYSLPKGSQSDSYYQKQALQIAKNKSSEAKFIPVAQYSKEGDFIQLFESLKEAAQKTGADRISIGQCCRAEIKSANGFMWRYATETPEVKITPYEKKKRFDSYEVGQYDLEGNLITVFSSISNIGNIADKSAVYDVIIGKSKTAAGFQWKKYTGIAKIEPLNYQTNRGKKVLQIDLKNEIVINEFDSLADAALKTGFQKSSIGKVAKGERKSAYGFLWKFR